MVNRWAVRTCLLLAVVAVSGCSHNGGNKGASATKAPTAQASVAAASPGPAQPVTAADYQEALRLHSCYADSLDAAQDPVGRDVSCDDPRAAHRLVVIQAASKGDCAPNQLLVSEQQLTPDSVAPSMCLEPVTH